MTAKQAQAAQPKTQAQQVTDTMPYVIDAYESRQEFFDEDI